MELALSLMVLAAIVLVIGAFVLWRKRGARKQIALMLLLALIMAVNVAIWTLPDASGTAPLGQELK
jgi:drug/metabolite transporter superfamily protein YnfA